MAQSVSLLALLTAVTSLVHAQNVSSSPPTFTFPSGYTTSTFNNSAQPTPYTRTDFSPNALASLWDLVGPVATGPVTSTVSPTPEPTAYAQPDAEFYHPLVGSGYPEVKDLKLPVGFKWGLSSSAYQIEGAAKDEGKGPSIWDLLSHRGHFVSDNSTGDVVASQYWLYKQDFARLKGLGIPAFGLSLSWPRFFPFGHGPVNQEAVQHYDDVIAEMHAHGIKPAVSIFHWDTPLALFAEYGAWTDRRIVDHFFNYAKFVISRYDEYVDEWFTINEPQYCNWQYSLYPAGQYYPAPNNITGGDAARFLCGHHTLLAHARVAKWYHNEFHGGARITFKNSGNYYEARNPLSDGDQVARQRNFDFSLGWFGGPWTNGDYPASLKETLGDLLPSFTQPEKDLIKGSCDFFAIDPYSSYLAHELPGGLHACVSNRSHPSFPECAGSVSLTPDSFPIGPAADPAMSWLYSAPAGVRRFLKHITTELFPSVPDIVVAEFGFAEPFEARWQSAAPALWDLRRADYLQNYLDNILLAIHVDGVNVTGAWGWAIFDNFEWALGTSVRFGLQYVNYTSLERTPKASMFQFLNWFKAHEHEDNSTMRLV